MNDTALVVVDMLYDFIDGSLACQNADEAVRETLGFIDKMTRDQGTDDSEILGTYPILFICDHHPADHSSFKEFGGIWPAHCVQGTRGGSIHKELAPYANEELIFYKGTEAGKEQYSGFEGINSAGQSLAEILELLRYGILCQEHLRRSSESRIQSESAKGRNRIRRQGRTRKSIG